MERLQCDEIQLTFHQQVSTLPPHHNLILITVVLITFLEPVVPTQLSEEPTLFISLVPSPHPLIGGRTRAGVRLHEVGASVYHRSCRLNVLERVCITTDLVRWGILVDEKSTYEPKQRSWSGVFPALSTP